MAVEFQRSTADDAHAIMELMLDVYNASRDVFFNNHGLFHWKYFAQGPEWKGSRGYVMRTSNGISAHLGICPAAFASRGGRLSGIGLMDWVSRHDAPGLGTLLLRKVLANVDVAIVAGGSAATQRIIPRLGFVQTGELEIFAKVLRPWCQFRSRLSGPSCRDALRLVRNVAWTLTTTVTSDWNARRTREFGTDALVQPQADGVPLRTTRFLNYWLRNPAVAASGFTLEEQGQVRGYFVLSRVGHQTRIVDLRAQGAEEEWAAAFATANSAAAADPDTYEVIATSVTPLIRNALLRCGFRYRRSVPLFLYDPQQRLSKGRLFWSLIEDDSGYIRDSAHPYET
ncbi:MAG: hypothetical protein JOY54_03880 [Acidobacteriaceae bacterium]|nr:hypothetical protein [Acidobacteriaceae bacterium]